ncbi:hypothetical protein ACTVH1_16815 [Gluconobacter cerinus]
MGSKEITAPRHRLAVALYLRLSSHGIKSLSSRDPVLARYGYDEGLAGSPVQVRRAVLMAIIRAPGLFRVVKRNFPGSPGIILLP